MAMTVITNIIDDILRREGGFSDHEADAGGRTDKGITERDHPEAWADGRVTDSEAREIYRRKYVEGPNFHLVPDPHLMAQLVDYGVNSGPYIAIKKLQGILGVKQDGQLGPKTLAALAERDPRDVGNKLVAERIKMIGHIVSKNKSQIVFLNGWLQRALEFLK